MQFFCCWLTNYRLHRLHAEEISNILFRYHYKISCPNRSGPYFFYWWTCLVNQANWLIASMREFFSYLGIKQKLIEESLTIYRPNDPSEMLQTLKKKKKKKKKEREGHNNVCSLIAQNTLECPQVKSNVCNKETHCLLPLIERMFQNGILCFSLFMIHIFTFLPLSL